MADNVTLSTVTTGGVSAASDDIGGVHYQRIKITLGADGTTTGDVSSANPMPVVNSAAVTVTGSVGVSGPVTVTGTVAATQSGSWGIAGPVTVTGSVTSAITGPVTVTGTVAATQSGSWGIAGPVTVTGTVAATQSGTWNVNNVSGTVSLPTGAATAANQSTEITALQLIDNPIVAHDAAISGATGVNVIGLNARSADPTAVATADATQALATLLGKLVNQPYAIPAQYTSYANATAGLATTVAATAFASAGASTRWYITSAQFINQGGAVTRVHLQDGAGALYYTASLATSGGGVAAAFPVPIRIAANQTVEIKLDTTGTTVYTNLQGYKAGE